MQTPKQSWNPRHSEYIQNPHVFQGANFLWHSLYQVIGLLSHQTLHFAVQLIPALTCLQSPQATSGHVKLQPKQTCKPSS